jgi:hypothetical protein
MRLKAGLEAREAREARAYRSPALSCLETSTAARWAALRLETHAEKTCLGTDADKTAGGGAWGEGSGVSSADDLSSSAHDDARLSSQQHHAGQVPSKVSSKGAASIASVEDAECMRVECGGGRGKTPGKTPGGEQGKTPVGNEEAKERGQERGRDRGRDAVSAMFVGAAAMETKGLETRGTSSGGCQAHGATKGEPLHRSSSKGALPLRPASASRGGQGDRSGVTASEAVTTSRVTASDSAAARRGVEQGDGGLSVTGRSGVPSLSAGLSAAASAGGAAAAASSSGASGASAGARPLVEIREKRDCTRGAGFGVGGRSVGGGGLGLELTGTKTGMTVSVGTPVLLPGNTARPASKGHL